MSVTHDPFHGLRLWEDAMTRLMNEPRTSRPWSPAVDILETDDELVVKADLPDVDPNNIDVQIENQTLTIRGERKFERETGKGFHRIERSYGAFIRSFTVPSTFNTDSIAADYKNGVLTVKLPKREAAKPRQIRVQAEA